MLPVCHTRPHVCTMLKHSVAGPGSGCSIRTHKTEGKYATIVLTKTELLSLSLPSWIFIWTQLEQSRDNTGRKKMKTNLILLSNRPNKILYGEEKVREKRGRDCLPPVFTPLLSR